MASKSNSTNLMADDDLATFIPLNFGLKSSSIFNIIIPLATFNFGFILEFGYGWVMLDLEQNIGIGVVDWQL